MTINQALSFFTIKEMLPKLQAMSDVGLDYLTLGQPLSTLSGGECQRLKLASEFHKQGSIYVMDEPMTGLHLSDIGRLLTIMNRLVDGGNTVIVIEHHLDVIATQTGSLIWVQKAAIRAAWSSSRVHRENYSAPSIR